MAQLIVRELNSGIVRRLKARAKRHGRSLEAELRDILERAAHQDRIEARKLAQRIRRKLSGRVHSDSGALIAEDRSR